MAAKCYVIIGAGVAGVTAAETIRGADPAGEILLLSKEKELPYSRPMLSKAPLMSMELKPMALHEASWYRAQRIELRLGTTAERLDPENHRILCGGEWIAYDACILATGAYNFIPPFPGRENVEICDIRTLEDLRRVRRLAVPGGKAVVIGGGVIGLEIASEIRRYGMEVTVLEALDRLMPRLIDAETSAWLAERLPLDIVTGVKITGLRRAEGRSVVDAEGDRSWPCDLLVVSCGVRAETALAREAGLTCSRAIVVNERMETDVPDVYACGDCAEFRGVNYALWNQGQRQGAVAGANAAGGSAVYTGCDSSLVMQLDDVGVFALGDLGQSGDGYTVEEYELPAPASLQVDPRRPAVPGRGKKVWKDGRLKGVALLGNLTSMNDWKRELLEGRNAE